jgi:hypothetical protein
MVVKSKKKIEVFMEFIKSESNSNLLAAEWEILRGLIENLPEDKDDEGIWNVLESWLQDKNLMEAYSKLLKASTRPSLHSGKHLGIAGSKSPTKPGETSPSTQAQLINSIPKNAPLINPSTANPANPQP